MEDFIDKLKDNPAFQQFEEFVFEKIQELDSVVGLEKMTDRKAGEEAKIRAKSKAKLLDILSPFINFSEKVLPTAEQIKTAKKKNLL